MYENKPMMGAPPAAEDSDPGHLSAQCPNTGVTHSKTFGVRGLLDQLQTVVLNAFGHSHNNILLLSFCPRFPSLGVPYNREI